MAGTVDFVKVLEFGEKFGCKLWRTKGCHRIIIHLRTKKKFYLPVRDRRVDIFYVDRFKKWIKELE